MLTAEDRVRLIRTAFASKDRPTADRQFTALLKGSERSTERWLRHVIMVTPVLHDEASAIPVCEDLRQELALDLWKQITTRNEMAWEHTYWRSLLFAQQHVATRYMRQAGYWVEIGVMRKGRRAFASLVSTVDQVEGAEAPDMLIAAEVASDMRSVVMQLPPRERAAVVLHYWQGMRDREVAHAMGCTDRTVRTLLHQARKRLGPWYEGLPQKGATAREL
jgi:RNA polymerase sigma factor (sigma-70 family)